MMLIYQLYSQLERLPVKPPVTIALLALNIIPHILEINLLGYDMSNIGQNCIKPSIIVTSLVDGRGILLNRLVLAGFMHVDESHLYYNMMSLCWKGINLEIQMGTPAFLQLVVFSFLVSHSLMVLLSYVLYIYSDFTASYHTCAIGFSAVLFSLKYVWNLSDTSNSNIMGINVSSNYAAWLELILVSVLHPNVSFIGHLSGILAGIIYVHGKPLLAQRFNFSSSMGRRVGGRPSGHRI